MGILDWFINRQSHFELEPVSRQLLQSSIEKAVSLVDPRLKLVPSYHKRLQPAVESALHFLQETVQSLPPPLHLVAANWSSCAQSRAFFTASAVIAATLDMFTASATELPPNFNTCILTYEIYVTLHNLLGLFPLKQKAIVSPFRFKKF